MVIYYIIEIILTILRYFIILFHNYSIYIMRRNEKKEVDLIDNLLNKYKILEFILFTISIIIGIPRLYMIWIFYFFKKGMRFIMIWYIFVKKTDWLKFKVNNFREFLIKYYFKYEVIEEPGS